MYFVEKILGKERDKMKLYFAWANENEDFNPDIHALTDGEIFSLSLTEREGDFPLASIEISNPYIAIMWVNYFNTEGRYFSRWMNQQYLVVSSSGPNTIGISYKTISGLYSTYDNISGHAGI